MPKFTPCGHKECGPCYMKNYESKDMEYLDDYLKIVDKKVIEQGCFIDVGAHVGLWSLYVSDLLKKNGIIPQIYALEPLPISYRTLLHNAQLNATSGIIPVRTAAWFETDTLILESGGIPARCWAHAKGGKFYDKNVPKTQAVALDDVAEPGNNKCWGMKIDVEGAELQVLMGARQMLMDNETMHICLEYNVRHFQRFGHTHREVNKFLIGHGFQCVTPEDEKHSESPPTTKSIVNVHWVKGI